MHHSPGFVHLRQCAPICAEEFCAEEVSPDVVHLRRSAPRKSLFAESSEICNNLV
jgi:hypothetical protein